MEVKGKELVRVLLAFLDECEDYLWKAHRRG